MTVNGIIFNYLEYLLKAKWNIIDVFLKFKCRLSLQKLVNYLI